MEFGKSLRSAREAKGYTVAQIAEKTHMLSAIVEGLENEDFSRIAAPIYGRNFVRLYCEAVGLESRPFVDEFMEILNGNHAPAIRERPVSTEPPPAASEPQVEELPAAPQPTAPEPDLFQQEPLPDLTPAPEPASEPAPEPVQQPIPLSRYAAPIRERPLATGIMALNPRIIVLAALVIAFLIAVILGTRALYRATTPGTAEAPAATEPAATEPAATEPAAIPAPRSRQQKIPSLYID